MYLVNIIIAVYALYMAKRETQVLHMNIGKPLLERIDKYRFKRMFQSRSEAIEFLLERALKLNPERPEPKAE
jgi:metal-responsive CopG/Arc/MetJ family transcriptional regulator